MRFSRVSPSAGFTLVEMMIVLAIVAILLGIGLPSFNEGMRDKRLSSMTSEFISAVYVARNEALTRRKSITLAPLADGWAFGWIINDGPTVLHTYVNPNIQLGDGGQSDMRVAIFNAENNALDSRSFVFLPRGQVTYGVGGLIGGVTVRICDDRPAERGRTLAVSAFGTVQNTEHLTPELCLQVGG